jgi:uncharacterized protein (DUF1015 family)
MVKITSFKGITYNNEKITPLDHVMSPPYDIISEKMQNTLYKQHPYNFVRLILGKQLPEDSQKNNRYTRANHLLDQWQKEKILLQSQKNAIYPYQIEYTIDSEPKTMNGFFVLLQLDPEYSKVKAHERTLAKPKADRLNLMRACHTNLEPIQLLYMDQKDTINKLMNSEKTTPLIQVTGYDEFTHTLWKIENKTIIEEIADKLREQILFIADGHHRYQTAINFAEEQQLATGNTSPDAAFNYRMVILVNMFDPGLAILPTHRLIKMPQFNLQKLLIQLKTYFTVTEQSLSPDEKDKPTLGDRILDQIKTTTDHKFALYHQKKYYVLTLKDEAIMNRIAGTYSKTWRTLDVSILHKIVLEKLMGITEENLEDHVKYTRVNAEAIQFVDEKRFDFSFLMNPTKINELKAIAEGGEHMPQKSTYFLPKMLSGLVLYKMDP